MDDETRSPKTSEDYMAQIIARLNANSASDAWLMVDRMMAQTNLVWFQDNKFAFQAGVRVGAWKQVVGIIQEMIDNAVITQ